MKHKGVGPWLLPIAWMAFGLGLLLGVFTGGGGLSELAERPLDLALLVAGVLLVAMGVMGVRDRIQRYQSLAKHMASDVHTIAAAHASQRLDPASLPAGFDVLAKAINELAARYERLLTTQQQAVSQARAQIEEERARLLAVIQNLAESVLVCNPSGDILLYNHRSQELLGEMVGLGRRVFQLFKGTPLEQILAMWDEPTHSAPQVFITRTVTERFVRVRMTPVLEKREENPLQGFVLTMEDVTHLIESASRRDKLIEELGRNMRRGLANIRAAIETLSTFPDMQTATRSRLEHVIEEEVITLSQRLESILQEYGEVLRSRWRLEDMPLRDFIALLIHTLDIRVASTHQDIDQVWIQADTIPLTNVLSWLSASIPHPPELAIQITEEHVHLTFCWPKNVVNAERLRTLLRTSTDLGTDLEGIVAYHGGEAWVQSSADSSRIQLVILLPTTIPAEHATSTKPGPTVGPRPEYYDFQLLFRRPASAPTLEATPLRLLSYTVFDTETTGLAPSEDEIIAIGAVRIVHARLLEGESFQQLIKPRRPVPPSATRIHGIRNEDLIDAPPLEDVLPRFYRYVGDSVLVAHNAAFDMRFLQEAEKRTGVKFQQPVLDTLLLSALVHPEHKDHNLEAIAERLGVAMGERHSAWGDAITTARILLKLIPLLEVQGIFTLGEAIEASEQTYFARIRY